MIGSLFSGIGGLELGLELAGLGRVAWQVEQDEWCRSVLARHWPEAVRHDDVRTVGAAVLAPVGLICGGFPCQDVSAAGKQRGLAGARSGLWREFARIVAELRPRAVVVENVASGAKYWLCAVRGDLVQLGYRTEAFSVGACDVGLPHARERIFVVAYADAAGRGQERVTAKGSRRDGARGDVTHGRGVSRRCSGCDSSREPVEAGSVMGGGAHGIYGWLVRAPAPPGAPRRPWEPMQRRTEKRPDDARRLAALGNAVVPACAYVAGMRLREMMNREAAE